MLDTFYFMTSPFILGGGRRNIGTRGLKKREETLHSAFRGTQFCRDDSWSGLTVQASNHTLGFPNLNATETLKKWFVAKNILGNQCSGTLNTLENKCRESSLEMHNDASVSGGPHITPVVP